MGVKKFTIYPMKYENWYYLGVRIKRDMQNYLDELAQNEIAAKEDLRPKGLYLPTRSTKYQYVKKFNNIWRKSKFAKDLRRRKNI